MHLRARQKQIALVIDDDILVRQVAREVLEGIGLQVEEARDGPSGLAALAALHPDIVLLDFDMPGLNGVEVCRRIRRQNAGQGIPVLMFTGHDDGESVERAYEAGATDYLCKPINCALLQHRVRFLLKSSPHMLTIAAAEPVAVAAAREELAGRAEKQTLLLIDHDPNVISSLCRLFRNDDYTVLSAVGPAEAFTQLAANQVQVMIVDPRMPLIDGTDFLAQVKLQYPKTVRIVLSGYTRVDSVIDAINHGSVYRFFTKPWEDHDVRAGVREAFAHHWKLFGDGGKAAVLDAGDKTEGFAI
jgi:DNA-binding response OmpR family regulator